MKSMTDFIMEQEQPAVVTESYTDADLVSDYMSLCAASANMACIYECATIVEFCQANDIAIPDTLVQEGFSEFMSKIWKGIADFFEKIAEWFKGLVKKSTSTFAKASIQKTIAKLKTLDENEEISGENGKKILYIGVVYNYIIEALESFRQYVITDIVESDYKITETSQQDADNYMLNVEKLTADLKLLGDKSNWLDAQNAAKANDKFQLIGGSMDMLINMSKDGSHKITIGDAIEILEKINELNIPANGTKLLQKLDADQKKFYEVVKQQETVKNSDGSTTTSDKFVWQTSGKTQDKVKKCADALAKAYDTISLAFVDITNMTFKDTEVAADKKKEYDKEVAKANNAAKSEDIKKKSEIKL